MNSTETIKKVQILTDRGWLDGIATDGVSCIATSKDKAEARCWDHKDLPALLTVFRTKKPNLRIIDVVVVTTVVTEESIAMDTFLYVINSGSPACILGAE